MIIRREQMDLLSESVLKQFIDRMVAHLKQEFPEQTVNMPEDNLRNLINESMQRAETYDITDEVDIERYLECVLLYGRDFDVNPETSWAGEILRNEDLSGFDKMNQINDYELFSIKLGQR
jgi:hypothetical protein